MAGEGVRDSTTNANVDLVDAGSYRFKLSTELNSTTDEHTLKTRHLIDDNTNKKYQSSAWYGNKSVADFSLLHGMFTYNVPADKWYEMINDVEQLTLVSATSVNGKLNLVSGALNEKRQLRTYRHPRYEPNRGHLFASSIFLPAPDNLAERTFGLFTKEAGIGFRLRDGVLYSFRRNTVDDVVTDYEEVINTTIDLSKGHLFDIQFQWRGVGTYFFYIDLELVATVIELGTRTELTTFNPALPIAFECINQGGEAIIECGCVDVTTEGGSGSGKSYGSIGISNQTGSVSVTGFNQPILVVKCKHVIGTKINTRDVLALLATAYGDQRAVFRVWATRDDTAITENDQPWVDFRDGHMEYIEYDNPDVTTPMTFDTSKATLIFNSRVNADSSYSTSAMFEGRTEIYQTAGDIFIFTMHRENGTALSAGVTYEFAEAI